MVVCLAFAVMTTIAVVPGEAKVYNNPYQQETETTTAPRSMTKTQRLNHAHGELKESIEEKRRKAEEVQESMRRRERQQPHDTHQHRQRDVEGNQKHQQLKRDFIEETIPEKRDSQHDNEARGLGASNPERRDQRIKNAHKTHRRKNFDARDKSSTQDNIESSSKVHSKGTPGPEKTEHEDSAVHSTGNKKKMSEPHGKTQSSKASDSNKEARSSDRDGGDVPVITRSKTGGKPQRKSPIMGDKDGHSKAFARLDPRENHRSNYESPKKERKLPTEASSSDTRGEEEGTHKYSSTTNENSTKQPPSTAKTSIRNDEALKKDQVPDTTRPPSDRRRRFMHKQNKDETSSDKKQTSSTQNSRENNGISGKEQKGQITSPPQLHVEREVESAGKEDSILADKVPKSSSNIAASSARKQPITKDTNTNSKLNDRGEGERIHKTDDAKKDSHDESSKEEKLTRTVASPLSDGHLAGTFPKLAETDNPPPHEPHGDGDYSKHHPLREEQVEVGDYPGAQFRSPNGDPSSRVDEGIHHSPLEGDGTSKLYGQRGAFTKTVDNSTQQAHWWTRILNKVQTSFSYEVIQTMRSWIKDNAYALLFLALVTTGETFVAILIYTIPGIVVEYFEYTLSSIWGKIMVFSGLLLSMGFAFYAYKHSATFWIGILITAILVVGFTKM